MKTALLYRISSLLLVLFAPGHTMGFRRIDPRWRIDSLVSQLRSTRFDVQGFSRTYWDFFTGFGFFCHDPFALCLHRLVATGWFTEGVTIEHAAHSLGHGTNVRDRDVS
jgi:hypothetical protein